MSIDLAPKRFHVFSAAKAKEKEMDFDKDGYGFLLKFVRSTRRQPFAAEDVTLAAQRVGIAPPDLRNWGKLFVQAAKDGYIVRVDVPFRRALGNGTLTLGWRAI